MFLVGCPYGHVQQIEGRSTLNFDLGFNHTHMEFAAAALHKVIQCVESVNRNKWIIAKR